MLILQPVCQSKLNKAFWVDFVNFYLSYHPTKADKIARDVNKRLIYNELGRIISDYFPALDFCFATYSCAVFSKLKRTKITLFPKLYAVKILFDRCIEARKSR